MKIIRFEAEHVKRLQVVEITPAGHVVEITGKNGAGKTSILDAIWWALAGTRTHQPEPINREHTKARIKLDLGDLVVEREFKTLPPAPGMTDTRLTTRISVTNAKGQPQRSPQGILDSLLGTLSFDPLDFARKDESEQYRVLQEFVGIDLRASDLQNDQDFTERRVVNRTAKARRAAADQIHVPTSIPERIDVAALVTERQRRETLNAERAVIITSRESCERKIVAAEINSERLEKAVKAIWEELASKDQKLTENVDRVRAEAKRQIDALTSESIDATDRLVLRREQYQADIQSGIEKAKAAQADLLALPATPSPETFADNDEQIARAEAVNRTAQEAAHQAGIVKRLIQEAVDAEAESRRLTEAMEARKVAAAAAVEKAALPIPGLSLEHGRVALEGLPFSQASDADQLRASCAIAMRGDHKLRVIRIRDGSLLDDDSMAMLAKMAEDADYQVWIERVDASGQVGVVIEDGRVKAV